ncbi:cytochrome c [Geobacter sp.]|uniref:c-type cytochrome n=1 Tax=Geobacter sp. TaxID=46610 RepID=UPI0026127A41|nr:cytochrome c [Geobacter sp.]
MLLTSSSLPPQTSRKLAAACLLAACLLAVGCKSKQEQPAQAPASAPPQATMGGQMSEQQKLAMGGAIFRKNCASCHGAEGNGGQNGPSLQRAGLKYGRTPEAIRKSIVKGRPGGMPAFGTTLQEIEVNTLVAYVISLKK